MAEFTPRKSKQKRQKVSHSLDDRLKERLQELADRHYEGNSSRAIEGLILYEWLIDVAKRKQGKSNDHWISAPIVLREGELEPILDRLQAGDSDAVGTYIDARLTEKAKQIAQPPVE